MPDFSANYLTTDAQGNVSANFTGSLSARGVTFPAVIPADEQPPNFTPPPDKAIRWNRASDGAMVARVYSSTAVTNTKGRVVIEARNPDTGGADGIGLDYANVSAEVGYQGGALSEVVAQASTSPGPGWTATILDSQGASDFLKLATPRVPGLGRASFGFGQTQVGVAPGWGTYTTGLGIPVPNRGVMLPFYSIVVANGATIAASELPATWAGVVGANITSVSVDIDSSIAQSVFLSVMVANFN